MDTRHCCPRDEEHADGRRTFLTATAGLLAMAVTGELALGADDLVNDSAMSKEARDKLSGNQILEFLKQGNERFRTGKMHPHDYLAQKRASAAGQYPGAAILSCIDSRAPAEIVLDTGIGDVFNARIAGNIANEDVLGSLEFACALAGAKVILVMGHTACGAIKGAIDGAELGHLSGLLNSIKPAVAATRFEGERSSKNEAFVDAVAKTNVQLTLEAIRHRSQVLAGLERNGKLKIAGAMYHLVGGKVEFLA